MRKLALVLLVAGCSSAGLSSTTTPNDLSAQATPDLAVAADLAPPVDLADTIVLYCPAPLDCTGDYCTPTLALASQASTWCAAKIPNMYFGLQPCGPITYVLMGNGAGEVALAYDVKSGLVIASINANDNIVFCQSGPSTLVLPALPYFECAQKYGPPTDFCSN